MSRRATATAKGAEYAVMNPFGSLWQLLKLPRQTFICRLILHHRDRHSPDTLHCRYVDRPVRTSSRFAPTRAVNTHRRLAVESLFLYFTCVHGCGVDSLPNHRVLPFLLVYDGCSCRNHGVNLKTSTTHMHFFAHLRHTAENSSHLVLARGRLCPKLFSRLVVLPL